MGTRSRTLLRAAWLLLALALAPPALAGAVLKARVLKLPGATLQQVQGTITPAPGGGLHVVLQAAHAAVPDMGWQRVGLKLDGTLLRDPRQRWVFSGNLRLTGAPGAALGDAQVQLQLDVAANTLLLDMTQGKAHINTFVPLDQLTHAQIDIKQLPLAWLQGLLGTVWSGRATGGRLDAQLALDQVGDGVHVAGQFNTIAAGLDTPTGTLAAQGLAAAGRFGLDTSTTPARLSFDGKLSGGELLLGPIYARLPGHAVQLSLQAQASKGGFELSRLHVQDPDALELDASMAFSAKGDLQRLDIDKLRATFPAAYTRYGQAWLASMGLPNASIRGALVASVNLRSGRLHAFSFHTGMLDVSDASGKLSVQRLRGGLDWSAQGTREPTELAWDQLGLYRLTLGAGSSRWRSRGGELALQAPLSVPLFNGALHVSDLDWRPAADTGTRLTTSMALAGVDMASFSRAMGWPAFPGTLGGAIAGLRWVGDSVELEGGLSMNVFGGFVDLTGMSLQSPFGPAPVFSGDFALSKLNLGAITSVFDIGSMTGRLSGSITGLRLVGWSPVAFDAHLLANQGGEVSQRAVNNLTSVGGGSGIGGGLQGAVLGLFKHFGYKRMGLNCRLQNAVCHMSGLEPTADGYLILQGSGLPRLTIVGHESRVDWPVLVRRVKAAIEGAPPVVR